MYLSQTLGTRNRLMCAYVGEDSLKFIDALSTLLLIFIIVLAMFFLGSFSCPSENDSKGLGKRYTDLAETLYKVRLQHLMAIVNHVIPPFI